MKYQKFGTPVRTRLLALALFASLAGAVLPGLAAAQEKGEDEGPRFHLGKLEIHPGADVTYKSDDNIFLQRAGKDEESDTILTYTPSLKFKLPFGAASSVDADGKWDIIDYDKNEGESTENLTVNANLNLEKIFGDYYLRTNGKWEDTSDPSSTEEASTANVTGNAGPRTPKTTWGGGTKLGFGTIDEKEGKLHLELSGKGEKALWDRASSSRLEKATWTAVGLAEYRFSPKTAVRLEYEFERLNFINRVATDQRDDSRSNSIRAGLSFTSSALITGHATLGWEFQEFDKKASLSALRDRNSEGYSADIDLTWDARPSKTKINVKITAGIDVSSSPGLSTFRKYKVDGDINQKLFFIKDFLPIGGDIEASFKPSWQRDTFRAPSNRSDTLLKFIGELKYTLPFKVFPLIITLEYKWERKNSNEDVNDYLVHTFMAKAGMKF